MTIAHAILDAWLGEQPALPAAELPELQLTCRPCLLKTHAASKAARGTPGAERSKRATADDVGA